MSFISYNPYTKEELARFPFCTSDEIDNSVLQSHKAFLEWSQLSFKERGKCFENLGSLIENRKEELARIISIEMGKVVSEARTELEKSALTCAYYAQHSEDMLKPDVMESSGKKADVVYAPLGVIFGIFPWNFPFWQVLRFAIPSLMAGNTAVFKHSQNVPQSALAIEKLFVDAGFPPAVLSNIFCRHEDSERIIANDYVRAVTLTGSERAGRSVAALAGKHLKKVVLELGGSDPFIVLPDADIKEAAKTGVRSRFQNTGQSCIAAKRFIIHRDIYDAFRDAFIEEMKALKTGNPLDANTTLGVIARKDLCDKLEEQVKECLQKGAIAIYGGSRINEVNFEPTLLSNISEGMPAWDEELFGPVASFFKVKDVAEAIQTANATHFGLSASLWTNNKELQYQTALQIQSGMVYINSMSKSTPELPFGGIKNSGIGRELSPLGIKEFTNAKLIFPLS